MREIFQPSIKDKCRKLANLVKKNCPIFIAAVILIASFGCQRPQQENSPNTYDVSAVRLEKTYGRLVTVANMPTTAQNGTGDRLGLFRDKTGTIWGIPITRDDGGNVVGCVPPNLRKVPVSDTLPADTEEIVGAANEPTNWRGGTGGLELLIRNKRDKLIWYSVKAVGTKLEPVCWSHSAPVQPLPFYRLVIAAPTK